MNQSVPPRGIIQSLQRIQSNEDREYEAQIPCIVRTTCQGEKPGELQLAGSGLGAFLATKRDASANIRWLLGACQPGKAQCIPGVGGRIRGCSIMALRRWGKGAIWWGIPPSSCEARSCFHCTMRGLRCSYAVRGRPLFA